MKNSFNDERMIKLKNILLQIEDVDKMIELHKDDQNKLMLEQYQYRRERFLLKLNKALKEFKINPVEMTELTA